MRILEIRRHTMRRKPGAHLSRDGMALARLVAEKAGPFSHVVTSTVPRAIETAIAMGFEVDETVEALGHLPEAVMKEVGWPSPFAHVAASLAAPGAAATFAAELARLWRSIANQLPDGEQGLIVTHGLFIELGALASVPGGAAEAWGEPIGYCEGVRLVFEDSCQSGEILRVPAGYQLIEN